MLTTTSEQVAFLFTYYLTMDVFWLSRKWFDWSFENPEKVKPIHSAIFFFSVEHCNRLWWKEKFWFPTSMVMEAIWVKKWKTYKNAFDELVEWGFIIEIEKSKNQYSSCIISIWSAYDQKDKAQVKALDKALSKHSQKQGQSTVDINIQETRNKKQETYIWATRSEVIEELNKIIVYWNDIWKEERKVTAKLEEAYLKARRDYSKEDIKQSLWLYIKEKKDTERQYRLDPLRFFTQKNWFITYL